MASKAATRATRLAAHGSDSVEAIMLALGGGQTADSQLENGTVVHAHGGVSRISGLRSARMGALVRVGDPDEGHMVAGLVVGLQKSACVVALLGEEQDCRLAGKVGQPATLLGPKPAFPVGEHVWGAVSDPLGLSTAALTAAEGETKAATAAAPEDAASELAPLLGVALPKPAERAGKVRTQFTFLVYM